MNDYLHGRLEESKSRFVFQQWTRYSVCWFSRIYSWSTTIWSIYIWCNFCWNKSQYCKLCRSNTPCKCCQYHNKLINNIELEIAKISKSFRHKNLKVNTSESYFLLPRFEPVSINIYFSFNSAFIISEIYSLQKFISSKRSFFQNN